MAARRMRFKGDMNFDFLPPNALRVLLFLAGRIGRNTTLRQISDEFGGWRLTYCHQIIRMLQAENLVTRPGHRRSGIVIRCKIEVFPQEKSST